jgi:parvulin-like peptidyl-prolyl isomerase
VLVVISLGLAACGDDGGASLPPGVVAQVGDAQITQPQLDRALEQRRAEITRQGASFPQAGTPEYDQVRQQALEAIRLQRIVDFEARKCGTPCEVTPDEVDAELKRVVDTSFNGSRKELDTFLKQSKLSEREARDLLRSQLQQQELFDHVTRGVRFGDARAREYYAANPGEFTVAAGRTARHILVPTKAKADALREQVTLDNFGRLARENSTDKGSAVRGGDLGPIIRGQLVPEFEEVAFKLKDGEISPPVKTQFGWHIITVETTPKRTTPFAEAKAGIISSQLQSERQKAFTEWRDGVIESWDERTTYADESLRPPDPDQPTTVTDPGPAEQSAP